MGFEQHQGRNHGNEDTDEERSYFDDRAIGKFVQGPCVFLCRLQGKQCRYENDDDFS